MTDEQNDSQPPNPSDPVEMARQLAALTATLEEMRKADAQSRDVQGAVADVVREGAQILKDVRGVFQPLLIAILVVATIATVLLLLQFQARPSAGGPNPWLGIPLLLAILFATAGLTLRLWSGPESQLAKWANVATVVSLGFALIALATDQYTFWTSDKVNEELTMRFGLQSETGGVVTAPMSIGPFIPLSYDQLEKDKAGTACKAQVLDSAVLVEQVCAARSRLSGAKLAVVIGRHDKTPVRSVGGKNSLTNPSLAQRRADEVARLLGDGSACGSTAPVANVVTMSAAPRMVVAAGNGCDRSVEIVGLGVTPN